MADSEERVVDNPNTDYESEDLSLVLIASLALVILAVLVAMPFILRSAFSDALGDANRKMTVLPPGPMLQTDPAADLRAFNAEEQARLNSYGWIDRGKGIVHIPIREAMEEAAAKGIPGFPEGSR
jgi:hypothetical protein